MVGREPARVAERTVFAPIERLTVRRPYEPRSSGSRDQLRPRRPPRPGAGGRLLYAALRSRPGGAAALREDRLRTTEGDAPRRARPATEIAGQIGRASGREECLRQ